MEKQKRGIPNKEIIPPIPLPIEPIYTEEECRNMVFNYAQYVIRCMEGISQSQCVGTWFEKNKK